jgi:hypothetical protein
MLLDNFEQIKEADFFSFLFKHMGKSKNINAQKD